MQKQLIKISPINKLAATTLATALIIASPAAFANQHGNKDIKVQFDKGTSSAHYYGQLKGDSYDSYNFYAKKGQKLKVEVAGGNVDTYLFGTGLADSTDVGKYSPETNKQGAFTLPKTGKYELRVLQPRSQANQGKTPKYWLKISIR